jgi:hypothetical protein
MFSNNGDNNKTRDKILSCKVKENISFFLPYRNISQGEGYISHHSRLVYETKKEAFAVFLMGKKMYL